MTPEKRIEDYLHLYLMCKCKFIHSNSVWVLTSVGYSFSEISSEDGEASHIVMSKEVKPILRPLSDMTEEERKEFEATQTAIRATPVHQIMVSVWTPESFRWALSKHFDLFGLIESGLAIQK